MSSNTAVENDRDIIKFLGAQSLDKFRMISDDTLTPKLQSYLGTEAYAEARAIAEDTLKKTGDGHLGINVSPNIIFVPGVMGSLLSSRLGGVWWIDMRTRKYINSLRLAPDGKTDATPEHGITPFGVDITYLPFFAAVDKVKTSTTSSSPTTGANPSRRAPTRCAIWSTSFLRRTRGR